MSDIKLVSFVHRRLTQPRTSMLAETESVSVVLVKGIADADHEGIYMVADEMSVVLDVADLDASVTGNYHQLVLVPIKDSNHSQEPRLKL